MLILLMDLILRKKQKQKNNSLISEKPFKMFKQYYLIDQWHDLTDGKLDFPHLWLQS